MTDSLSFWRRGLAATFAASVLASAGPALAQTGDYIVAVVNQELVTAAELQQRMARIRDQAARNGATLPPPTAFRQQVLEALIEERVLVTNARDSGTRVEDSELDRAVANVATQNQLTLPQLRERLRRDGIDYVKFRESVKDQILVERVREREVAGRIKVTDAEIDAFLEQRRAAGAGAELNIAQILITVPEGAGPAVVAERRARAAAAMDRVRRGEDFATVATQVSEDTNRAQGGAIGLRPVDRLPDVFVRAVQTLKSGEVAPELLRSGAGFHVLKVLERKEGDAFAVQQARTRHILLRPSAELTAEAASRRLAQFRRDIMAGTKTFEQLARENSEDASAAQGGDLGWASPGQFVPEFEDAMAALPIGGLSEPVVTRFGVHLIQVIDRRQVTLDRKQQRDQARNALREQKFEDAYTDWLRDLRGRAYVELRDPPQ
jgi:peptidyl-prolyl cis-trans isomerase SurA